MSPRAAISGCWAGLLSWKRRAHCGVVDVSILLFGLVIALLLSFIVSFLLGYLSAVAQVTEQPPFVYYYPHFEYQLDRSPGSGEAEIMETREYQVKLPKYAYTHRMDAIAELTELLRSYTGEKLNPAKADIGIYWENHYLMKQCGHKFSELRRHRAFTASGSPIPGNSTAIDINQDAVPPTYKADAMRWNLTAAPHYSGEEKLEQDIHTKSHKFNRKSKAKNLPQGFDFTTCGQVYEMFPWALDAHQQVDPDTPLEKDPKEHFVWQYSFKGDMYFGILKYKFSWTLYFKSLPHALNLDIPPSTQSEFSFRIYSPGKGLGPWQFEGLVYAAGLYETILKFYKGVE